MELVPNCPPDLRIYRPGYSCRYPSPRVQSEHRSGLLHKIHNSYCKALQRLSLRARPGMAARFLHAGGGFCLGLLDPVYNVVANALISYGRRSAGAATGEPGADDDDLVYVPEEALRGLERRSLDGMVAFLTHFFPYLADCEATRFLLLADADLLVAARIAAVDLGISLFGSPSLATVNRALRMVLKCAALAAKHPDPDGLVRDWLAISSRLDDTTRLLDETCRRSPLSSLDKLAKLLDEPPPPPAAREGGDDDHLSGVWRLTTLCRPHLRGADVDAAGRDPRLLPRRARPAAGRRAALPLPPQPARGRPLLRPARSRLQHHRQHHLV